MFIHLILLCLVAATQVAALFNPFVYRRYAPNTATCPSSNMVRSTTSGVSPSEAQWLQQRHAKTNPALIQLLSGMNLTDFDAESFVNNAADPISIGLTFSGGGYRAMLVGAGSIAAYDSRTAGEDTTLKGLLQSSTYLAGLSGGSWLVGTLAMNNFMSVDEVLESDVLWDLKHSIVDPGFINPFTNVPYYIGVAAALLAKSLAGFEVNVVDIWSRALSHQFLGTFPGDGAGINLSSLGEDNSTPFYNADMPFPIMTALTRAPNETVITLESTVIEFNPYEMGSWDPQLAEFAQMKYVGTPLDGGESEDPLYCITGFDNAGFVMGTSSALFTDFYFLVDISFLPKFLQNIIHAAVFVPYQKLNVVLASWTPNPFYNSNSNGFLQSNKKLYLVDGGLDRAGIPFEPLIQHDRKVDVIIAHDNSANPDNWPDGSCLVATSQRQNILDTTKSSFPSVPDAYTFRNANLTAKPTFFGCYPDSLDTPLVIYNANRPFSYWSNTSTGKLDYPDWEKRGMIQNGYEVATRNNGTIDPEWNTCVGCAIINREQSRQGIAQSDQCKQCFNRYCWDGSLYTGPQLGENFDDNGLTVSASDYNEDNVAGINNGGVSLFKRASGEEIEAHEFPY